MSRGGTCNALLTRVCVVSANMGLALFLLGLILLAINIIGLIGACCSNRVLLIIVSNALIIETIRMENK